LDIDYACAAHAHIPECVRDSERVGGRIDGAGQVCAGFGVSAGWGVSITDGLVVCGEVELDVGAGGGWGYWGDEAVGDWILVAIYGEGIGSICVDGVRGWRDGACDICTLAQFHLQLPHAQRYYCGQPVPGVLIRFF